MRLKIATFFRASLTGTVITALCCGTPVLVISLGALGLGAWVVHLDAVLLPLLGLSVAVTLVAWWRLRREGMECPVPPSTKTGSDQ